MIHFDALERRLAKIVEGLSVPPLGDPRWFFSGAAAFGTLLLALMTGLNLFATGLAAACAFAATIFGLRLGVILIAGVVVAPVLVHNRAGGLFLSPPWLAVMVFTASANLRATLLASGLAAKPGALNFPRDWQPGRPGHEGPVRWFWELVAASSTLSFVLLIVWGVAELIGLGFASPNGLTRNGAAAVALIAGLLLVRALAALLFTLIGLRRMTREEAKLTLIATLHRELRPDLLFLADFRARRRL